MRQSLYGEACCFDMHASLYKIYDKIPNTAKRELSFQFAFWHAHNNDL